MRLRLLVSLHQLLEHGLEVHITASRGGRRRALTLREQALYVVDEIGHVTGLLRG